MHCSEDYNEKIALVLLGFFYVIEIFFWGGKGGRVKHLLFRSPMLWHRVAVGDVLTLKSLNRAKNECMSFSLNIRENNNNCSIYRAQLSIAI